MRNFYLNEIECCEINGLYGVGCFEDHLSGSIEIEGLMSLTDFDDMMYIISKDDEELKTLNRGDVVKFIRNEKLNKLNNI